MVIHSELCIDVVIFIEHIGIIMLTYDLKVRHRTIPSCCPVTVIPIM